MPENDQTIILDTLGKLFTSVPAEAGIGIIFDSVSDMIVNSGIESCLKFLRRTGEILSGKNVVSVFLLTHGAHEDREVNLIQNLFPNHLLFDKHGPKITRFCENIVDVATSSPTSEEGIEVRPTS